MTATATPPAFTFRPARREAIGLLIGFAGSTGSGKTFSALRLATGLADGKRFAFVDTEAGRALHYADQFEFDHASLDAPFRPDRYLEAIKAADDLGYPVIVVDSASHEHAGEGGLLDWHEEEFQRMGGREAVKMSAWIKPKMAHKQFVGRLLQIKAHLILCFRAEEKVEMAKDEKGRTVIVPKRTLTGLDGWVPICEKNLPYELTTSFLFTADAPGMPKPIKLQEQHRLLVPLDQPISEDTGAQLAKWARGAQNDALQQIDELSATLLGLAEQLGVREVTTAAVQENRTLHRARLGKHVDWLHAQIANAETALAGREEQDITFDLPEDDAT